ncbi:hypothetical protein BC831DRAFT_467745 [Entophlyctis helioformis]|nr:hypothetical protein BC831DRAFT_467745 [Entophlyctis helioformis]
MDEQRIAEQVHAALYSTSKEQQEAAVTAHYAFGCTFHDPLVAVAGMSAILAQFRALTWLPAIHSAVSSVHHFIRTSPFDDRDHNHDTDRDTDLECISGSALQGTAHHDRTARDGTTARDGAVVVVVVDAVVTFVLVPGLVRLPLRILSHFEFDRSRRIVCHDDVWSLREALAAWPLGLGSLYDLWRRVNGAVSTAAIVGLVRLLA